MVSLDDIRKQRLIDARFVEYVDESSQLLRLPAEELLTFNRFDIAIKIAYLNLVEYAPGFAQRCYDEHIRAFGLGKYSEPEQPHKTSLAAFLEDFNRTYGGIRARGFDEHASVIPLARDGSILNGAHRVASAIVCQEEVTCVKLDIAPRSYGYEFFNKRGLSEAVKLAALEAISPYRPSLRTLIIWPREFKKVSAMIGDLKAASYLYEEISVSQIELSAIVRQVYQGSSWLGGSKDGYRGANDKAKECLGDQSRLGVLILDEMQIPDPIALKERIRDAVGAGKHSAHISDAPEDTIAAWRSVLNRNFRAFSNLERFGFDKDKLCSRILKSIEAADLPRGFFCVTSGAALELLGQRECRDVDLIYPDGCEPQLNVSCSFVDLSTEKFKYFDLPAGEIVFDPSNHFYYNGLKVIAPEVLRDFYMRRHQDVGDLKDLLSADLVRLDASSVSSRRRFQGSLYFGWLKARRVARAYSVGLLKTIGMYAAARNVWRRIR